MTPVVETDDVRLYCGDSATYPHKDVDLILTNVYGPLPPQFHNLPMILTDFADRLPQLQVLAGCILTEVARYGMNGRQGVWVGNLEPQALDLSFLGDEMFESDRGWWPLDLPVRLLEAFAWCDGLRVWDGFMGRATTGKACQLLGHKFIGIDRDSARVALARRYLGI